MKLIVHELGITGSFGNTQLRQLILTSSRNLNLYAIRPHLYKHLAPAGSLYVQVQDANGKKVKDSTAVTISSISSANYFHGYVRFTIDIALKAATQYYIALLSTGYTYGAGAFIGWCNDFGDLRKVTANYSTPSNIGYNSPLDYELWERKLLSKGDF